MNQSLIYKTKKISVSLLLLFILSYFGFHAIYGNRGLLSYTNLNQQLEKSWKLLYQLRAEKLELEHRVNLLRPQSLDLDMLDEQARKVLGFAKPEEKVFSIDKNNLEASAKKDILK